MKIKRQIRLKQAVVRTEDLTLRTRHDLILTTTDGAALYLSYDAASNSFSAKRFDSETDAIAHVPG